MTPTGASVRKVVTKDTYHYDLRLGSRKSRNRGYRPKSWWARHPTAIIIAVALIGGSVVMYVNWGKDPLDLKTAAASQKKHATRVQTAKQGASVAISARDTEEVSP